MTQDGRLAQLTQWVQGLDDWQHASFTIASADASFRRYFRIQQDTRTAIVMDAPPEKEDSQPFVAIAAQLAAAGVYVPDIKAQNLAEGFLLLEDLGDTMLNTVLDASSVDHYYRQAIHTLLSIQHTPATTLAPYSTAFMQQEMALMPTWFLQTHLGFDAAACPQALLEESFSAITAGIMEQPQVFVHRDFHSRNLMLTPQGSLAVIDFQGALQGPVSYDLVSLLRDCYVYWPPQQVWEWVDTHRQQAIQQGIVPEVSPEDFRRWFDLTGLQRHIKVLGIFARLYHRDGKAAYLADLPRVLHYVMQVGAQHAETTALVDWLQEAGIPERIGRLEQAA